MRDELLDYYERELNYLRQLGAEFGQTVIELVDGVTKLDKVRFRSRQEAAAESFRKMLLAMARDLRVILIKLADRLHNMRTLGAMDAGARRRIARETLDIYAPIAQRLGMNRFKAELQDLGFRALYPDRHRVVAERIRAVLGNRREAMARIEVARDELAHAFEVKDAMVQAGKRFGFAFVTLDLQGYRMGSHNEVIVGKSLRVL